MIPVLVPGYVRGSLAPSQLEELRFQLMELRAGQRDTVLLDFEVPPEVLEWVSSFFETG